MMIPENIIPTAEIKSTGGQRIIAWGAWEFFRAGGEIDSINAGAAKMLGLGNSHRRGPPGFIPPPRIAWGKLCAPILPVRPIVGRHVIIAVVASEYSPISQQVFFFIIGRCAAETITVGAHCHDGALAFPHDGFHG